MTNNGRAFELLKSRNMTCIIRHQHERFSGVVGILDTEMIICSAGTYELPWPTKGMVGTGVET